MAGDVFDLDALDHEATGKPFTFRFDGDEYTLPAHLDMRAAAALSGGRLDDGLRLLLGVEQWDRLQAAEAVFDERHLNGLMEAYSEHVGVEMGESPASSRSSKRTARPSKRTSRPTTRSR